MSHAHRKEGWRPVHTGKDAHCGILLAAHSRGVSLGRWEKIGQSLQGLGERGGIAWRSHETLLWWRRDSTWNPNAQWTQLITCPHSPIWCHRCVTR